MIGLDIENCSDKGVQAPSARLTVSLPRGLYRDIRLHALEQDITLSALIAFLIRKELRTHK